MTAKNLATIITEIRNRGDLRNSARFPDSLITQEAQAAFAEGYEVLAELNEGFFDVMGNVTTVTAQGFIALPSDCWIVRAIDRVEGSDFVPVPRVGIKDRNRYGTANGRPVAHRLSSRGIELFPTPDAAYTLRIIYTPMTPTLDTTTREFFNSWDEFTVFGALVRLYDNMGRDSAPWRSGLELQRARITKAAGSRNSAGPELLNLREGWGDDWGNEDPDRWRPGF